VIWLIMLDILVVLGLVAAAFGPPLILGRYRWNERGPTGPSPLVHFAFRPRGDGWVRIEGGILGRCFYVHW